MWYEYINPTLVFVIGNIVVPAIISAIVGVYINESKG